MFQFTVTPATVIAFLTILGYSLYDTIVVFDRVKENEGKYAAVRMPYEDVVNISMNQVLMRSMMTSFSSIIPVLSLLILGSSIMGAVALKEFALALLVGMISGVYSSIFIATPLLAWLKRDVGRKTYRDRLVGDDLRAMVMGAGAPPAWRPSRPIRRVTTTSVKPSSVRGRTTGRPAPHAPAASAKEEASLTTRCGSVVGRSPSRRYPPTMAADHGSLRSFVREIKDYPTDGVTFRDITPLLGDGAHLRRRGRRSRRRVPASYSIDRVVGVESRGFIFASAVAYRIGAGLVPVRKAGKLPWAVVREEYDLEYGSDKLEIHRDAIHPGERILIIDDVLATGGTAAATAQVWSRRSVA